MDLIFACFLPHALPRPAPDLGLERECTVACNHFLA